MTTIRETCSCGATFDYSGDNATDARYRAQEFRNDHRHEFAPSRSVAYRDDDTTPALTTEDSA